MVGGGSPRPMIVSEIDPDPDAGQTAAAGSCDRVSCRLRGFCAIGRPDQEPLANPCGEARRQRSQPGGRCVPMRRRVEHRDLQPDLLSGETWSHAKAADRLVGAAGRWYQCRHLKLRRHLKPSRPCRRGRVRVHAERGPFPLLDHDTLKGSMSRPPMVSRGQSWADSPLPRVALGRREMLRQRWQAIGTGVIRAGRVVVDGCRDPELACWNIDGEDQIDENPEIACGAPEQEAILGCRQADRTARGVRREGLQDLIGRSVAQIDDHGLVRFRDQFLAKQRREKGEGDKKEGGEWRQPIGTPARSGGEAPMMPCRAAVDGSGAPAHGE